MNNKKYVAKEVKPNTIDLEYYKDGTWNFTFKHVTFREWLEHFVVSMFDYDYWDRNLYDWGKKNNCETIYDWRKWVDVVESGAYDEKENTDKYKRLTERYNSEDSIEHKLLMVEIENGRLKYIERFWELIYHYAQFQATLANGVLEFAKESYEAHAYWLAKGYTKLNQMYVDINPNGHKEYIDYEASKKLEEN